MTKKVKETNKANRAIKANKTNKVKKDLFLIHDTLRSFNTIYL